MQLVLSILLPDLQLRRLNLLKEIQILLAQLFLHCKYMLHRTLHQNREYLEFHTGQQQEAHDLPYL